MISIITVMAITSVVIYVSYLLVLFFAQEKLLFNPPKPQHLLYEKYAKYHLGMISNNIYLQGWIISGDNETSNTIAIYFGGNAEDIAENIQTLKNIPAEKIYAFNYRGYGLSQGKPSKDNLYHDALLIYDEIKLQNPSKNITIIGYSLGSAIAGYVAKNKNPNNLVLLAPLESILKSAKDKFGRLIPEFMIKNNFDLSKTAEEISCESLVILAEKDRVIKNSRSLRTFSALKSNKRLISIPDATHNNILSFENTLNSISSMINKTTDDDKFKSHQKKQST